MWPRICRAKKGPPFAAASAVWFCSPASPLWYCSRCSSDWSSSYAPPTPWTSTRPRIRLRAAWWCAAGAAAWPSSISYPRSRVSAPSSPTPGSPRPGWPPISIGASPRATPPAPSTRTAERPSPLGCARGSTGLARFRAASRWCCSALKQAVVDPALRREALEALAVVGTGGSGEDEILAAALNDQSSDVRRRGVEVAAAIDRRQGKGTHAAILRTALADASFAVRSTVLHECASLDGVTAASILAIALADKDPSFRRLAEKGVMDLATRAPSAATDAVRQGLGSSDSQSRRTAVALLDRIAAAIPREAMSALTQIAADEKAPEEARISALSYLRNNGEAQASLRAVLEKAVAPDAPPRLRTAALPIYARLIDPAEVETLATAATKGPPAGRVTGAALWGGVAIKQPDSASRALKVFLYDQSPDVRAEAARAFGYLKREGPELVRRALVDPSPEVAKAAIESSIRLAASQPALVAEDLGHAMVKVRPATRKAIVEALGQIGQTRPAAVLPPLAKALKQSEIPTRVSAARAFCEMAKKAPVAAAPY